MRAWRVENNYRWSAEQEQRLKAQKIEKEKEEEEDCENQINFQSSERNNGRNENTET